MRFLSLCAVALLLCAAASAAAAAQRPKGGRMNAGLFKALNSDDEREILRRSGANVAIEWHRQKLDHYNPQDDRTFLQQYQVNDTYYKTDGPIFLLLGGEGPASPVWLSIDTAIMEDAKHFNAMVVQLEHRFYGKSQPFDNLSTDNLRYLSSQQALADTAAFVTAFKANRTMPEHTAVVVYGGSYSGALAAFFRTKYPQVALAAVANSAPVLAKLDFFEYHEVVSSALATASPKCPARIENATATIASMLFSADGRAKLIADLNVTDSKLLLPADKQNFMETLAGNIDGVVQYNRDNRAFEGGPPPPTVQSVCDIVLNETMTPYDAYIAVQRYLVNGSSFEVSYLDMIGDLSNTSLASDAAEGGRQWTYQTCVEFGYFQTTDAADQPFGHDIPLTLFTDMCRDIFGINITEATIDWTNTYYGGLGVRGTRIIYPNGSIDPWHALSLLQTPKLDEVVIIYMDGTAHCAPMYPPSPKDLKALTKCRSDIRESLQKWLSQW